MAMIVVSMINQDLLTSAVCLVLAIITGCIWFLVHQVRVDIKRNEVNNDWDNSSAVVDVEKS